MGDSAKFRQGTGAVTFPPVPFLLFKPCPRNNVLIGDDALQLRFVEQLTGQTCETLDSLTDENLFGKDGCLYRLLTHRGLAVSESVRKTLGVWSLTPITSRSASSNALVRAAALLLKEEIKKERLEAVSRVVGRLFEKGDLTDLRTGLWEAVWIMTGDLPVYGWSDPWESTLTTEWFPKGVDLELRLGALMKTLRAYVLTHTGADTEVKRMGIPPHRVQKLKDLTLNPDKIFESVLVLSRWKQHRLDPKIVALMLTKVWAG